MKNIMKCETGLIENLGDKGIELVDWCVDFLLFNKDHPRFPKKDQSGTHKEKYITIWSFVYDFLKIGKDTGYDYWLLTFLEWNNLLEHGCAIRCGWYNNADHYYKDRVLADERKNIIIEWAANAPDNI